MIQFQISAPASLSLFGEQTENIIRAGIDLRTTLNFQEVDSSNDIEINFPEINIFHKISLQEFLKLYDECIKNMERLNAEVLIFTNKYTLLEKRFLNIFYYLLVYIMHEKQIARAEIKTFKIDLSTQLLIDKKVSYLAPLKVCLAACFLHWTRLQKNIHNTYFDKSDLSNICIYATFCESDTVSPLDTSDITVCANGYMAQCDVKTQEAKKMIRLPKMPILLVDSKQTEQDLEIQKQQVTKIMSLSPHIICYMCGLKDRVLNIIDHVTNKAVDTFQKIFDISNDNELSAEIKTNDFLHQFKILEVSHVT